MTWLTTVLQFAKKGGIPRKGRNRFIDSLRVHVQGGPGGMGYPKYGGVGGRGGNVYVEAKEHMNLKELKSSMNGNQRVKASAGGNSSARCILGKPGDDVVIQCPPGVSISNELGYNLGEVMSEGDSVLVAQGGPGGGPTNGFCGMKGQAQTIRLDLKIIADVAFVGFPNAGKSSLLSKLSRAKPKIASYPFTTMRPLVGTVKFLDEREFTMADLPGLIEGAHVNRGLGHEFLRHVERSKVLLLVVDVQGFQLSHKYPRRTCIETILLLNREIELYKEFLLDKPAMLLLNKMDTEGAEEKFQEVVEAMRDISKILPNYAEEFRPVRPFEFVSIQKFSALKATPAEISLCLKEIRRVLDVTAVETEAELQKELELLEKLNREKTEYGPTVV